MHIHAVKNLENLIESRKIPIDLKQLNEYLDRPAAVKCSQENLNARLAMGKKLNLTSSQQSI